ncbi:MAG: hypothetical protein WCC08_13150 [Terrimicrobiaceae bacterium]
MHRCILLWFESDWRFDTVVSHLYPLSIRKEYGRTCETAGKSGKQIERCLILSFQVAESVGFRDDFRQWEHLLRVGD